MSNERNQRFHAAYINADEKELQRLWDEESPSSLIKFYPAIYLQNGVNYFLEHLNSETMWLSSPLSFNDPFDCVYNCDYSNEVHLMVETLLGEIRDNEELQKFLRKKMYEEKFDGLVEEYRSTMSVLRNRWERVHYISCFSESENVYSKRMWGYYANSHKGVCAEYEFSQIKSVCPTGCIPIVYSDVYNRSAYTASISEDVAELLKLVYHKSIEWEYEKEWRIVSQNEDAKIGFCVSGPLPKKIYLGCKIERELKQDILNFCVGKDIEVYQMRLIPGSFNLGFEKCK